MKNDSKITIAIYLCILCNINLKISTVLQYVRFHGLLVTTFAFWLEGHEFESHPGQAFFYFFLSKWDKKWRNMWASEGVRTKLGLFNFSKYVIDHKKAPTEIRQLWNVHFLILRLFNSIFEVKSTYNEIVRSEECKSGDK